MQLRSRWEVIYSYQFVKALERGDINAGIFAGLMCEDAFNQRLDACRSQISNAGNV
jgi:hypothetical protein